MDSTAIYSENFKIRASEVDTSGRITISAICSLFQEVAGNHALILNFDITDLHKKGLTWVLHRMDIKIDIIFLCESVSGDTILSKIQPQKHSTTIHQLVNQHNEIIAQALFEQT